MNLKRTSIAAALVGAAMTTVLLTGCSGGQSKAQACSDMAKQVSSVSSDIQSNASSLASNPQKAADAISKLDSSFKAAADKVSQADVKTAAEKASSSLHDLSGKFSAYAKNPKDTRAVSGLSSSASGVQSSFGALQKVCTG